MQAGQPPSANQQQQMPTSGGSKAAILEPSEASRKSGAFQKGGGYVPAGCFSLH